MWGIIMRKYKIWKRVLEGKGLWVNVEKEDGVVGKLMFGRSIVVSAMKGLVVNLCCIDLSCQT